MPKRDYPNPPNMVTLCYDSPAGKWSKAHEGHGCGFVFHRKDDTWSEDEIVRVVQHPDVVKYFPEGAYAYTCATFAAQHSGYFNTTPKESNPAVSKLFVGESMNYVFRLQMDELYFARGGFVWFIPAGGGMKQYCRHLFAVADCEGCPIRATAECFNQNLQRKYIRTVAVPPQRELFPVPLATDFTDTDTDLDADEWREGVTYWKTKIAGYTAIPPKYVTPNWDMPGKDLVSPVHADFYNVEDAWDKQSDNSIDAAKTRRMHREECSNCIFSAYVSKQGVHGCPCTPWASRSCEHGHWTEESATRQIMKNMHRILKKCRTSWTLRQMWCFAQVAGYTFEQRNPDTNRKCQWTLSQICNPRTLYGEVVLPLNAIVRRDSVHTRQDLRFPSYQRLYKWLPPDMQRRLDAEWQQAPTTKTLVEDPKFALWLCASSLMTGRPYCGPYQSGYAVCTPEIHHVETPNYATGPVTIVVATTVETDEHRVYDFDDLLRYLKAWRGIPLLEILKGEGGGSETAVKQGMHVRP